MFEVEGKKVLITGASSGIGKATAKKFAEQGAIVTISARRKDKLEEIKSELGSDNIYIVDGDLSDMEFATALSKLASDAMGGLDVVVCNAGITRDKLFLKMTEEDFDAVINTNLKSSFLINKEAGKIMFKQRVGGSIINISSVVAFSGNFGQTNYAASKAGLVGMSKSFALEFAPRNITVNCIAPGFIATEMTEKLNEDQKQTNMSKIPLGRFGNSEDIANSAIFLSSNEASYITGQTIHVNGGMLMI